MLLRVICNLVPFLGARQISDGLARYGATAVSGAAVGGREHDEELEIIADLFKRWVSPAATKMQSPGATAWVDDPIRSTARPRTT
jgi:hypothetical protein